MGWVLLGLLLAGWAAQFVFELTVRRESRDVADEMKRQLDRVEAKLDGTWVEGPNSL